MQYLKLQDDCSSRSNVEYQMTTFETRVSVYLLNKFSFIGKIYLGQKIC